MSQRQVHPADVRTHRKETRSGSLRKSAKDGGYTPSEKRKRDRLLKQFSARAKGYAVGVSEEFKANYDLIDWGSK